MAVTNIPNVQNWTVTPQNGQAGYFDLMNTWLGQSTLVIASLQSAITAQNAANSEINSLATQAENNAIIATGLANYQGEHSLSTTYSKGQSTSVAGLYYTSKVDGNLNHAVTDTNYWVANPINDKASTAYVNATIKKRKNYLINGNFQFWDYATSQTTSGYGSDNRFDNKHIGSTKLHTRQTSTDTERALFESPYYSRTVVSSVAGTGNGTFKIQRIEDVTKLAGKTITFSMMGRADTNRSIAVYVNQNFGTGGSPSSNVMGINPTTLSLSTNIAKKSFTITIPPLIGKTLGTDGVHTSFTELVICFEAGSNFNSYTNSLGQQSGTFDIGELKLEDGIIATDGWAPYDGEWGSEAIAKERYFRKYLSNLGRTAPYDNENHGSSGVTQNGSNVAFRLTKIHTTEMRTPPTVSYSGVIYIFNGVDNIAVTSISNNNCSSTVYSVDWNVASAFTAASGCIELLSQGAYIALSAEIG